MRALTILAAVAFSTSAFADNTQWSTVNSKHPLWEALTNTPVSKVEGSFLNTSLKELKSVECSKVEVPSSNPILPVNVQYHCNFAEEISSESAQELFEALNVEAFDTSGAYTQYKVVDKMIVVGSDDVEEGKQFARVYLKHPCQNVYSKRKARSCMNFWATKVLPSFEDSNDSAVASVNKKTLKFAEKAIAILNGEETADAETLESFAQSDYIGMMVEHIYAGRNFTYFNVAKGKNVVPQKIGTLNLEDSEWNFGPTLEALTAEQKKDPVAVAESVVKNIFLGGDYPQFEFFQDDVEEGLVDMIEYLD